MVDNQKYFNLLKQETNKFPDCLYFLKRFYDDRLSYLSDSKEDTLIKDYVDDLFLEFNFEMNRMLPSKKMNLLVIPLLGRCNLNCKGCDAYAPLCKNDLSYYSALDIYNDLNALRDKGFSIKEISFEGGEPFLYEKLDEVVKAAREVYRPSDITILTNGTLLRDRSDSFYETIASLDCGLVIDKYFDMPDFESTVEHIKSLGVRVELDGCVDGSGWFHRAPLDLQTTDFAEDENAKHFVMCEKANNIFTLDRGYLYPCGRSASIKYFNRYFNTHLPECGIDIYASSGNDIATRLASPCELCKYCKPFAVEKMVWGESSLDINEWADI